METPYFLLHSDLTLPQQERWTKLGKGGGRHLQLAQRADHYRRGRTTQAWNGGPYEHTHTRARARSVYFDLWASCRAISPASHQAVSTERWT